MLRSIAAGVFLAFGLAGAAAAEPFDDFVSMCLRSDGDPGKAAAGADAAGWFKMPLQEFLEEGAAPVEEPSIYMSLDPFSFEGKALPPELRMLMTGVGEEGFGTKGVQIEMCAVGAFSDEFDYEGARSQLAAYFDFEPALIEGEEVWAYSRHGAQLRSEAALIEADGLDHPPAGSKIFIAGVTVEGGSVMFILGAVRPLG